MSDEELGRDVIDALLALRRAHAGGAVWVRDGVAERVAEGLAVAGLVERSVGGVRLRPEGRELADSLARREPSDAPPAAAEA